MSILTPLPPKLPFVQRAFLSIPVVGWMARDVLYGDPSNRVWAAVIVASLWLWSVATYGVFMLLLPFVLAIPGAFYAVFLILVALQERRDAKVRKGGS